LGSGRVLGREVVGVRRGDRRGDGLDRPRRRQSATLARHLIMLEKYYIRPITMDRILNS